ncbi:hypothetical protein HYT00_00085 [Candidatus Giovannonibacteria bacterium]|nr:hypothetical protein [Candidatus Giovannonibacteria bacterium]
MKGFTIFEVVITASIIAIISAALLGNYTVFAARMNLRRAAQQMAFSIREVQASAFAVRGFDPDGTGPLAPVFNGWGANFDKTISLTEYRIFVDLNGDNLYQSGELVKTVSIPNNVKILNLCAGLKSGDVVDDDCTLSRLDIFYQRPNPDTALKGNGATAYSDLEIQIQGTEGSVRTVVVLKSGQISTE